MTTAQSELRAERIAIMVIDGGLTENAAEEYCDSKPQLYGIRDRTERQDKLF